MVVFATLVVVVKGKVLIAVRIAAVAVDSVVVIVGETTD